MFNLQNMHNQCFALNKIKKQLDKDISFTTENNRRFIVLSIYYKYNVQTRF